MWKVAFNVATILALLPTLAISAPTTAIVAGAGVGGLYTAAKLAQSGVAVTLVEQNSRDAAGGRLACETVVADGRKFRFETGPSLLLLPSIYREALSSLGLNPSKHLNLKRCMPSYGVHFRDGLPSPLEIGGNAASERALEQAMDSVEPGSYTAYCDYLVSARANLKAGLPIFIREQLGLDELATLPGFLRAALLGGGSESERTTPLRDWPLRSHAAQASELFTAERHRELACFQDLYIGLAPQDAPSVFSLLQAIELAPIGDDSSDSGIFYPLGGWGNVRDALLEAVESSGVDCRWNTKVEQVLVSEGDEEAGEAPSVRGVRISPSAAAIEGKGAEAVFASDPSAEFSKAQEASSSSASTTELTADCVVVNADLAAAEGDLLPPSIRRSAYKEKSEVREAAFDPSTLMEEPLRPNGWQYSSSTISLFFCLSRRYEQLRHHNVFLGPSTAWEGLFDATEYTSWADRIASGPPMHFYVHAPARTDPSVCERPTDDAIMVLVPVPPLPDGLSEAEVHTATERLIPTARAAVIEAFETAGMAGFANAIVDERVRTPPGWKRAYGLARGSVFGLSHPLEALSFFRPGRKHGPKAKGLHWVGASTQPGNGVPLVLIGAMKAAGEVLAGS